MNPTQSNHRSIPTSRRRIAGPFAGALAGLALAGLLGACGTVQPPAQQAAQLPPTQQPVAQAPANTEERPLLGSLKNAETVVLTYTQTRKRAATLREAADTARTAALVARHRHTSGMINAVELRRAESELALAEQNRQAGELDARLARAALVRVLTFGMVGSAAVPVSTPAPAPLQQSL